MRIVSSSECPVDIPGYPSYYVTRSGKVLAGFTSGRRELRPRANNSGYMRVALSCRGVRREWLVHRVVATTFLPNPDNLETVNHIDGDKKNNCVDNLEWCSRIDNIRKYHLTIK